MKRRDFLFPSSGTKDTTKNRASIQSTIEEYTEPLDRQHVIHLLRRLTFLPNPYLIKKYTGKTAAQTVDDLLGTGKETLSDKPGDWVDIIEENPLTVGSQSLRQEIEKKLNQRFNLFGEWWVDLMREDQEPAMEKFVLFLSTIWCVNYNYDTNSKMPPALLYRNNQILRKNRIGNYKQLAAEITLDGAMILYQSLYYSTRKKPNENYMRELLELFTMGIGNYTEGDIQEGARVLTGWRTAAYKYEPHYNDAPFETYFIPKEHDIESKTFMGATIAARDEASNTKEQVFEGEVKDLLNIMFTKRANEIAQFICEKIYRYFVYSNNGADDQGFINNMAKDFVANDFDLRDIYKKLFSSTHFFHTANMGVQIKPPPEFIIGLQRQLGVKYPQAKRAIYNLDQELYNPPNVGSWEAYRTWISTATFPLRVKYGKEIIDMATNTQIITMAKQFEDNEDPDKLCKALIEYFLTKEVSTEIFTRYKTTMLDGNTVGEWPSLMKSNGSKAAKGIRSLIHVMLLSPDFQLS